MTSATVLWWGKNFEPVRTSGQVLKFRVLNRQDLQKNVTVPRDDVIMSTALYP